MSTTNERAPDEAAAYYQGLNSNQKRAEVLASGSVEELDVMWAAWEARGQSREGQLWGAVLTQKIALGYEPSEEEQENLQRIAATVRAGSHLPPIGGSFNPAEG